MWVETCGIITLAPFTLVGNCTGSKGLIQQNGVVHSYFSITEADLPGSTPLIIRSGGKFVTAGAKQFGADEAGTYSPVLTGETTNPSVTYFENDGIYSRVGNQVLVRIDIVVNTISGGSGRLQISLPFEADDIGTIAIAAVETDGITWPVGATVLQGNPQSATSVMLISGIVPSGATTQLQVSDVGANDGIFISMAYTCTQLATGFVP